MILLASFFLPAILTFLLIPVIIRIYTKNKWLDDPKKNLHPKVVHTTPLPRGAGIAIIIAIIITTVLVIPLDLKVVAILSGGLLLALVGFWDDIASPSPVIRLLLQVCAALLVIGSGIGIAYVTNPLGGVIHLDQPQIAFNFLGKLHTIWVLSDLLALFWIVWCMNIVNFSTGFDGQMPGYVIVSALVIAALSTRFLPDGNQQNVFLLSLIIAGSYLGFLYWNMYPQKILSGFGASTMAGFFLAVFSILSGAKLATAILVLALPMTDAAFVIIRRLLAGKSPFSGDRSHFHHSLLDLGLSKPTVAFFYWAVAAILGLLSLFLNSGQKLFAGFIVVVSLCMIVAWLRLFFLSPKK